MIHIITISSQVFGKVILLNLKKDVIGISAGEFNANPKYKSKGW